LQQRIEIEDPNRYRPKMQGYQMIRDQAELQEIAVAKPAAGTTINNSEQDLTFQPKLFKRK